MELGHVKRGPVSSSPQILYWMRKEPDGATHQTALGAAGGDRAACRAAAALPAQPDLRIADCGVPRDPVDAVPHQSRLDLPRWLVAPMSAARTANGAARRGAGELAAAAEDGRTTAESIT